MGLGCRFRFEASRSRHLLYLGEGRRDEGDDLIFAQPSPSEDLRVNNWVVRRGAATNGD